MFLENNLYQSANLGAGIKMYTFQSPTQTIFTIFVRCVCPACFWSCFIFYMNHIFIYFSPQKFQNTVIDQNTNVLRCEFRIAELNSTAGKASTDLLYHVLLGVGKTSMYTQLCSFTAILAFNCTELGSSHESDVTHS